jgi:aminoglycoside 6'-N-acetyltransferase
MKLRTATLDDVDMLNYWDTKEHVIRTSGHEERDWVEEISNDADWLEVLIAEHDGEPIGVLQIVDPLREETHYWGQCEPNLRAMDIWIGEEKNLGVGFGTQMMTLALAKCFADENVTAVLLDPLVDNPDAIRFYERLGFKRVERRMFGVDDCYVYRLDRDDWQRLFHP